MRTRRTTPPSFRNGYVFLFSVLVVGTISSVLVVSMLLIGIALERGGLTIQQSAQSFALAQTCMERAILSLQEDLQYGGGTELTFTEGSCTILRVGGNGNEDRTVCVQGEAGTSVRRIEALLSQVIPVTRVSSWQEVTNFTLCSP